MARNARYVATVLKPVSTTPGSRPTSMPTDRRPRVRLAVTHPEGPQPVTDVHRTSSGRAATENQSLGLHLTRPNTEPGRRSSPADVTRGVPTATSTDAEAESQQR